MPKPAICSRRRSPLAARGLLLGALVIAGLFGCNPIESYRSWTGVAANDPDPASTPNTKNLAAAEARSYPNLATVPPPPSRELTAAELKKLTQRLIAERANAKSSSEHLEAQADQAAVPPPPALPLSAPGAAAPSAAKPAASTNGKMAAATPAAGTASGFLSEGAKGENKSKTPPEPEPIESSLQSPQIANLPQPQESQSAPPPPSGLGLPAGAPGANATAPGAHLPMPPAPPPMPAAIGSAAFEPAPPPPVIPPASPVRTATASGSNKPAKPTSPVVSFAQVGEIGFSSDATTLTDADRHKLGAVATRYQQKPGLVRVVGYAGPAIGGAQQLNSYRAALDRAQVVAGGLVKAGIPAGKIHVEAAPAGDDTGHGRAEILFEE